MLFEMDIESEVYKKYFICILNVYIVSPLTFTTAESALVKVNIYT